MFKVFIHDFRWWLARKLCPTVFEDQAKYWYLRERISTITQWCGQDFPEVLDHLEWITDTARVHFMSLEEYYSLPPTVYSAIERIDFFRENMRRKYNRGSDHAKKIQAY